MNKHPLVSVIIATKNEEQRLPRLLISLKRQTYQSIEIIIVDNFSTDHTYELAKRFTPHVYQTGKERSQQRNFGAKRTHGSYLLFLDADMELPAKLINECVKVATQEKAAAIVIPETNPGQTLFGRIKKLEKELYLGDPVIEASRFFTKKIFDTVGGYNEDLIAGEDWDLNQRVRNLTRVSRITMLLIHHEDSLVRELKHKLYYARFMKRYARRHPKVFSQQVGGTRLRIFFSQKAFYTRDPLASIGLLLVKFTEFLLYKIVSFYYAS